MDYLSGDTVAAGRGRLRGYRDDSQPHSHSYGYHYPYSHDDPHADSHAHSDAAPDTSAYRDTAPDATPDATPDRDTAPRADSHAIDGVHPRRRCDAGVIRCGPVRRDE